MEENRVVEINNEKTEALKEAYKDTLDILDAIEASRNISALV